MKHIHYKPATHKEQLDFSILEAGDTFTLRGQDYEVWGKVTMTGRRSGKPYEAVAVTTACCACGATVEIYPRPEGVTYLSKRCSECAAPGKPSDGKGRFAKRDW